MPSAPNAAVARHFVQEVREKCCARLEMARIRSIYDLRRQELFKQSDVRLFDRVIRESLHVQSKAQNEKDVLHMIGVNCYENRLRYKDAGVYLV